MVDTREMILHGSLFNKKTELLVKSRGVSDSDLPTAHTRGRSVLGFKVPASDENVAPVSISVQDIARIMNWGTRDAQQQFEMCLKHREFIEPEIAAVNDYVKIVRDKELSKVNICSLVNHYANGGRTKLPQSSRLSGRYSMHHLGWFSYTKLCNKKCDMLRQGKRILFCRKVGNKKVRGMGEILFLSYNKGKGEYPISNWCSHVNSKCVLWIKCSKNGRIYRVNKPEVEKRKMKVTSKSKSRS